MRLRHTLPFFVLLAACFSPSADDPLGPDAGDDIDNATSDVLVRCDAYEERVCTPEGPGGRTICYCELQSQYSCDPITETAPECSGQQPVVCVAGQYQNSGAACYGGTSCYQGTCQFPSPPATSPEVTARGSMWQRHSYPVATPPSSIPLLVVYVKWIAPGAPYPSDPSLAHPTSYYENLLFGSTFPSAASYFSEVTQGRFTFTRAWSYGPYVQTLPAGTGADTGSNLNRIVTLAATAGFPFASYDTNHDGKVYPNELALMMISDNGGRIAGANRGLSPQCQAAGTVQVCSDPGSGVAEIEDEVQFASLVHEMSHSVGTVDLYGGGMNYRATLMGATIEGGGPDLVHSFWLDPWHRNQLAWNDGVARDYELRSMTDFAYSYPDTLPRGRAAYLRDSTRPNEYFIVEYRAPSGYDANVGDSGLAVWYVKENADHSMQVTAYDGGSNLPGVVTYNPGGTHGAARFLHPSDSWVRLNWADGSFSGFMIDATDDHGGYQLFRWGP